MQYQWPYDAHEAIEDIRKTDERWVVRYRGRLDDCRYNYENTYYIADPPTTTVKMLNDIEKDWPLIEKLFAAPVGYNPWLLRKQRAELGELGAFRYRYRLPGLPALVQLLQWRAGSADLLVLRQPEYIQRLLELHEKQAVAMMEMILEEKPDFVLLGASGTITMHRPSWRASSVYLQSKS